MTFGPESKRFKTSYLKFIFYCLLENLKVKDQNQQKRSLILQYIAQKNSLILRTLNYSTL